MKFGFKNLNIWLTLHPIVGNVEEPLLLLESHIGVQRESSILIRSYHWKWAMKSLKSFCCCHIFPHWRITISHNRKEIALLNERSGWSTVGRAQYGCISVMWGFRFHSLLYVPEESRAPTMSTKRIGSFLQWKLLPYFHTQNWLWEHQEQAVGSGYVEIWEVNISTAVRRLVRIRGLPLTALSTAQVFPR